MKPSERRAMKESLCKEAEPQPIEECANGGDMNKGKHGGGGFFQRHVMLITFIITATLVLTVFGPLGIDMLVAAKRDKIVNNKEDISISTVYSVYDNVSVIGWNNFKNFNYTDYSFEAKEGNVRVREYPVKGSRLVLKVGGPEMSNRPDYIYLIDYKTGKYVDVMNEDPRSFVKGIEE